MIWCYYCKRDTIELIIEEMHIKIPVLIAKEKWSGYLKKRFFWSLDILFQESKQQITLTPTSWNHPIEYAPSVITLDVHRWKTEPGRDFGAHAHEGYTAIIRKCTWSQNADPKGKHSITFTLMQQDRVLAKSTVENVETAAYTLSIQALKLEHGPYCFKSFWREADICETSALVQVKQRLREFAARVQNHLGRIKQRNPKI